MFNLNKLVRKNILLLEPYSSARNEFKGKTGVFFDANENPFGRLNRYPDPLQKSLKQKLAQLTGMAVETIFIGNGSDEVIDLAYRIFCEPGKDKALIFSPTYGMYEVAAMVNQVEVITVPLNAQFQIDRKALKKVIGDKAIKLIFICSPNNPTGNVVKKTDIEFILSSFQGLVIIDEAYVEFSSSGSWLKELSSHPHLLICQTLSKAWGLAGARIGLAYASPPIIHFFNKVKPPYNVSSLNQAAALRVLSDVAKFRKNKEIIISERKKMITALNKITCVTNVYPSEANFLLIEVTDAPEIYKQLILKRIITRSRHGLIKNCIRVTVGTPLQNKKLINALKKL